MTTRDSQGNLHSSTGRFTGKANRPPEAALGEPARDAPRPAALVPLSIHVNRDPDKNGGYQIAVEAPTGRRYLRGTQLHRDNGPAYEGRDGTQEWWKNGELHRDGAPAVIHDDGAEEWWEDGHLIAS